MENKKSKTLWFLKYFFWDILMIIILIINLLWIIFDWIFHINVCSTFFADKTPNFYEFYQPIHQNFDTYDLIFVSIYLLEFVINWTIWRNKNHRQNVFDYPIAHWYDLIGCIPSGTMIIFRFVRLISIFIRLDKMNIMDLSKNFFVKKFIKIKNIIIEEISDRVVLNVLDGIEDEFSEGKPVAKSVISDIVDPQRQKIIDLVFKKFNKISKATYNEHRQELREYISLKSKLAVQGNKEISRLTSVPVIGSGVRGVLEKSVAQTAFDTVDGIISDVVSAEGVDYLKNITTKITDSVFENLADELDTIVNEIVLASIELIKKKVNIKQWKINEIDQQIMELEKENTPMSEMRIAVLRKKREEVMLNQVPKDEIEDI